MVGEQLADGFWRRVPDMSLTSLRFSFVIDERAREWLSHALRDQEDFRNSLAGEFWTYVDVRDAASSCRHALQANIMGHEAYYINAPRIMLDTPVEKLLATYYPGDYPLADHIRGDASPVVCDKAERLLGWKARYDWEGKEL
jgi:nucleoside-diphosphate-sugar epimerase